MATVCDRVDTLDTKDSEYESPTIESFDDEELTPDPVVAICTSL